MGKEVGRLKELEVSLQASSLFSHILQVSSLEEAYTQPHFHHPDLICFYLSTTAQAEEKIHRCQVAFPQSRLMLISPHHVLAYQVLKHDLFDFVGYPLRPEEIQRCLRHIKKVRPQKNYLGLRTYKDFKYLSLSDILFLKADNNTTEFYLRKGKKIYGFYTLKVYQKRLPDRFLRIHKSYMVNTAKVWRIHFGKKKCEVRGHNHPLPFLKTYTAKLKLLQQQLEKNSF